MTPFVSRRPQGLQPWYWTAPRVAVVLFVLALGTLLWLLYRQELEEQHAALISDTLWVEQNLRFGLERGQEQLQQLGQDYFSGELAGPRFGPRTQSLLTNNPGMIRVLVLDDRGAVLRAAPGAAAEAMAGEGQRPEPALEALRLTRSTGNPSFSAAYTSGREARFALVVPQFREGSYVGAVLAAYSVRTLLAQQVPWWFAQRYRLSVADANGVILGSKSNVEAGEEALSHQIPFDPPGHGLLLVATSYKAETNLMRNLLAVVIIGLAAAVLASLWALRRHMQRRLEAEQALQHQYAFRKAVEDSLLAGLRVRDLQGRVTYVNPAFCRMVGYTADELVGREPPMPYWIPEELGVLSSRLDSLRTERTPLEPIEVQIQHRSGQRLDVAVYEAPLLDADGRHTGWLATIVDITERKRAEELARQQQERLQFTARLVTMGEMASTLAHEINQPLSAIASYTTGCINRLDAEDLPREDLREALGKLASQAQRAGRIIRRVYDFVRRSEPQRAPCDINAVVEEAIGLIEADARKRGVRIVAELADGLPALLADRVMLEQVLLNLMRNGIEAMQAVPAENRELTVGTAQTEGGLMVGVADRGGGIVREVAEHLFEPFFSTKPEGMGMGLNICRSIIEFHKGRLWVDANPQGGTIFRFTLPVEPA
ncbi:MAG: PAS domain S-box protein [Rhodocyclales bacterium]|nr:PAS domain S-box protein [Rhodocyclales bacterium]